MGPGLHPQYTRAQFAAEAVGGLSSSRAQSTTGRRATLTCPDDQFWRELTDHCFCSNGIPLSLGRLSASAVKITCALLFHQISVRSDK